MFMSDLIVPLHGDPWLLRPPLWTNWQVDPRRHDPPVSILGQRRQSKIVTAEL